MKDYIVRARSSIVISGFFLLSVGFCYGGGGFFVFVLYTYYLNFSTFAELSVVA